MFGVVYRVRLTREWSTRARASFRTLRTVFTTGGNELTTARRHSTVSGRDRRRSGDLALFRRALYQLSYPTSAPSSEAAVLTGFEPATSGLTGRRALQAAPQDLEHLPWSEGSIKSLNPPMHRLGKRPNEQPRTV